MLMLNTKVDLDKKYDLELIPIFDVHGNSRLDSHTHILFWKWISLDVDGMGIQRCKNQHLLICTKKKNTQLF